jgi:hypothetical protein
MLTASSCFAPKEPGLIDKQIARDVIVENLTNSSIIQETAL